MTNIVIKLLTMSIELCSVVSNLSPHQKVRGSYFICSSISGVICLPLILGSLHLFLLFFFPLLCVLIQISKFHTHVFQNEKGTLIWRETSFTYQILI